MEMPPHLSKLVVSSWFCPGKDFRFVVSTSASLQEGIGFLDCDSAFINDGKNVFQLKPYGHFGMHTSNLSIEAGTAYNVKIAYPGYSTIEMCDTVPSKVSFKIKDFVQDAGMDEWGYRYSKFQLHFKDPVNEVNFYELRLGPIGEGVYFSGLYSNDQFLQYEPPQSTTNLNLCFTDASFNGEEKILNVTFDYNDANVDYVIYFRNVSRAYFEYKRSYYFQYEANAYRDIWVGTADRAQVMGNVKNGYGIFAAYNETVDTIITKRFLNEQE